MSWNDLWESVLIGAATGLGMSVLVFGSAVVAAKTVDILTAFQRMVKERRDSRPQRRIKRRSRKIIAHAAKFEVLKNTQERDSFLVRTGIASKNEAWFVAHEYMWNLLVKNGATYEHLNHLFAKIPTDTMSFEEIQAQASHLSLEKLAPCPC